MKAISCGTNFSGCGQTGAEGQGSLEEGPPVSLFPCRLVLWGGGKAVPGGASLSPLTFKNVHW